MITNDKLAALRRLITESIRIQRDTSTKVSYIDSGNVLADVGSKQNHVVFGRRGCGKTLLLHVSADKLEYDSRRVYLNCEDFKQHTFPNVLIEILEAVFEELEKNLSGWFGKKRRQRDIVTGIREKLRSLREQADSRDEQVSQSSTAKEERGHEAGLGAKAGAGGLSVASKMGEKRSSEQATEETIQFARRVDKLHQLNLDLPWIKQQLREFFSLSNHVRTVFVQIDDFYHLRLVDQPYVADYVHRLCKDLPLYFKIATLRHSTALFVERERQPIGVQERHDFLPIDIDFTFEHFDRTARQVRSIFHEYGKHVDITSGDLDGLFKGEGFTRLVVAGGGGCHVTACRSSWMRIRLQRVWVTARSARTQCVS